MITVNMIYKEGRHYITVRTRQFYIQGVVPGGWRKAFRWVRAALESIEKGKGDE